MPLDSLHVLVQYRNQSTPTSMRNHLLIPFHSQKSFVSLVRVAMFTQPHTLDTRARVIEAHVSWFSVRLVTRVVASSSPHLIFPPRFLPPRNRRLPSFSYAPTPRRYFFDFSPCPPSSPPISSSSFGPLRAPSSSSSSSSSSFWPRTVVLESGPGSLVELIPASSEDPEFLELSSPSFVYVISRGNRTICTIVNREWIWDFF